MKFSLLLTAGVALALFANNSHVVAQANPTETKTADDKLLKGLDADLLEGLPAPAKSKPASDKSKTDQSLEDTAEVTVDPLQRIGQRMRTVEQRISHKDLSLDTRQLQKEIVDDLASLIEQAKKKQQGAGKKPGNKGRGSAKAGADGGNPTPAPATDSTDRVDKGKAAPAERAEMKDAFERFWGHLPEKLREELQNSLSEQFLPKYEKLIEEYYKRLAEERPSSP